MERGNITILAASLAPATTFLTTTLIIAIRFHYGPLQWVEVPNATPTIIINQQINPNHDIPLEQQPWIVAPIPQWPILINSLDRVKEREEVISESTSPVLPERRPPTTPRRHTPIIVLSPTTSAESTSYAPRSPSPSEYTCYISNGRGFDMGHNIRPITPHNDSRDHIWDDAPSGDNNAPPPSALISSNEFWDNITILYCTYLPFDCGSPDHRTPPPAGYRNVWFWDQPIQNRELTPKPVQAVEEPVAGPSNYWHNINKQCLSPPCRSIQEINETAISIHLNWFSETQGHSYGSKSSDTTTEGLPESEHINHIHGPSPEASAESSPIPMLLAIDPGLPSNDAI